MDYRSASDTTGHPVTSTKDEGALVRVRGVSKKFCRSLKRSLWYGLCDIGAELNPFAKQGAGTPARRTYGSKRSREHGARGTAEVAGHAFAAAAGDEDLREGEFYAVRDVSFELRRGECLGLIGHNGAGKTTLLKMLTGLIKPDRGRIEINGRVGALIALGAGFNPILTGRENIYINASVLGLSKREIDEKIEEIIDFSEIGEFIDSPVQNYSSGMAVRLGFAVATTLNPDILILDEVLAVGDAAFRSKCYYRIAQLQRKAAVIFVSHSVEQVARICSAALLLSKGAIAFHGDTSEGCERYSRSINSSVSRSSHFNQVRDPIISAHGEWSSAKVRFGESLKFTLDLKLSAPMPNASLRHVFYSLAGEAVAEWTNVYAGVNVDLKQGANVVETVIHSVQLKPGNYEISTFVSDAKGVAVNFWAHKTTTLGVTGATYGFCYYQMK